MIAVVLILVVVALVLFIVGFFSESITSFVLGIVLGFISLVGLFMIVNIHMTSDEYTGYIYSSTKFFSQTNYHIRFSENAGTDAQPEFCVGSNHPDVIAKLNKYVGSGTKVRIEYPAYFYLSNDIFTCGGNGITVQEVK